MRGELRLAPWVLLAAAVCGCDRPRVPPTPAASEPCRGATTQVELTQCWGGESRRLEAAARQELEQVASRLRARSASTALDAVQEADAAWTAYRDAQCGAARVIADGGSIGPLLDGRCRAALAEERRRTLASMLADLEPR